MAQLGSVDEACIQAAVASDCLILRPVWLVRTVAIFVKDLEGLPDLLLRVGILHFPCHHCQELGCCSSMGSISAHTDAPSSKLTEVDCSIAIGVHLVDHVLQFGL